MVLSRQLIEEHFINDEMAHSIVLLLIGLLRDKKYLNEIYERTINKSIEMDIEEKIGKDIISEKRESELREKDKSIEDIFRDEDFMKKAKELRRFYGKKLYISELKRKAKELGLGDIEINENNI